MGREKETAPWTLRQIGAVWYVRFRHNGRRHEHSTGERELQTAKVTASCIYADVITGRLAPARIEKLASVEFLDLEATTDDWMLYASTLYDVETQRTIRSYRTCWLGMFDADAHHIDGPAIAKFVAVRLGKVTRDTLKKELWALRAFLTWCVDVARVLPTLPTFPKLPKKATGVRSGFQRAKPVELTIEQVNLLLAALPEHVRPRYIFAYETGLRPETLDHLSVPEHWAPGSNQLVIDAEHDKNRWGRTVPLTPRAVAALESIAPEAGLIFGRSRYIEAFKKAVGLVGLPRETAPYDLRHGLATHSLEASGNNLSGVGFLLGHLQLTTTNRYVHSNRKAADAVHTSRALGEEPGEVSKSGYFSARRAFAERFRNHLFLGKIRASRSRNIEPRREAARWTKSLTISAENQAFSETATVEVRQKPGAVVSLGGIPPSKKCVFCDGPRVQKLASDVVCATTSTALFELVRSAV